MFVESVTLENFQCFGPRTEIRLDRGLTTFIGSNGSGKTAACQALLRLFGVSKQDRDVRVDDFHVPVDEPDRPAARNLRIEVVLAFPELGEVQGDDAKERRTRSVPEFFQRMAATDDGAELKVRIVLEASWEDDSTIDGTVSDTRRVVTTFAEEYGEDDWAPFGAAERSRIQMIYIPASRDGAREVGTFLRGRLWRAAQWSAGIQELVNGSSATLADEFVKEPVVDAVETALTRRWQELHNAESCAEPSFRLLDDDFQELVRRSELVFWPSHGARPRPARLLSDGQRSLLHLALTATILDVESQVAGGQHADAFALDASRLPNLTMIAVEEPENSLSPFFLSRIVAQLHDLGGNTASQAILSSHSASVMSRIDPEAVRYFRLDSEAATASVREITLPEDGTEAGMFLREAVHAYPELYFAKFVVLGEGDTEQLVIPRVARALGVDLDPSFVAVVPLGGRHTNHMWRLLNDLDIPHATLLDYDFGKEGAGAGRLRDACKRLADNGIDPFTGLERYAGLEDIQNTQDPTDLRHVVEHLRQFGVFFVGPLDLDYAMLTKFPSAYKDLEEGERGPQSADGVTSVFGTRDEPLLEYWRDAERAERLRWFRYLFLSRSKPSSHLRALGRLSDDALRADAPQDIIALVRHIQAKACL